MVLATKMQIFKNRTLFQANVVQLQAGPHVARHSVFSGLQKHSGKIFKSEI